MPSNRRERELARRRYERRMARQAAARARARRRNAAIGAALAAVLVVAAVVGIGINLAGGKKSSKSTLASKRSAASATPSASTSPTNPLAGLKPKVTVPAGPPPKKLEVKDLRVGTGAAAKAGQSLEVQYVGVSWSTRKQFDASYDRGQPFTFTLGKGQVIKGWDQGLVGMKVGGRRELVIPPSLGYGAAGSPPSIKGNETLVFVVDLVNVK